MVSWLSKLVRWWIGERKAWIPLSNASRVGVQTAALEWASVKRVPRAASRSRWGVSIW